MDTKHKLITMERKTILSTLWIFFILNMFIGDIHELFRSGFLEEVMTGVVNGNQVTEELLLMGGIMVEIPIAMVLLSRVLKYRINRWANIVAGAVTIIIVVINNTAPDMDDIFFAIVEVIALSIIIWYAWKWSNPKPALSKNI